MYVAWRPGLGQVRAPLGPKGGENQGTGLGWGTSWSKAIQEASWGRHGGPVVLGRSPAQLSPGLAVASAFQDTTGPH